MTFESAVLTDIVKPFRCYHQVFFSSTRQFTLIYYSIYHGLKFYQYIVNLVSASSSTPLIQRVCLNCTTAAIDQLLVNLVGLEQTWQTHQLDKHTWSPTEGFVSMEYKSHFLSHFHRKCSFLWVPLLWHAGYLHQQIQFRHFHLLQQFCSKFSAPEFFPTISCYSMYTRTYLENYRAHQYTVECHECQCKCRHSNFVDRCSASNSNSNAINK